MKILGGTLKGRNFYMPKDIRPTQNLLRAAIFDIMGHDLQGVSFLELYAGSGAMSLEAISRGASRVVMVEHDPKNVKIIRENCELLGIEMGGTFTLHGVDALVMIKRLASQKEQFNIVFFDPPYGLKLAKKTLKVLEGNDILAPRSFVVAQYDRDDSVEIPDGFEIVTERRYGASYLTILQKVKNNG